jgi:PleD family two-component response regulator
MPSQGNQKILAVLDDLFFTVKINEAAKRAGVPVEFVKSAKDVLDQARAHPPMIILDLNCASLDPLKLIVDLKSNAALKGIRLIGYVSHVQAELIQKAREAGCDMVLARSTFSKDLPRILTKTKGSHPVSPDELPT